MGPCFPGSHKPWHVKPRKHKPPALPHSPRKVCGGGFLFFSSVADILCEVSHLTHRGLVIVGNLGHRLPKRLAIQTAAAELAAAVCITSHLNNH